MNEAPREKILKLYTDTMQEIFTLEEQAQILIVTRSHQLDLQGPDHLKKTLTEAVNKKLRMKPMGVSRRWRQQCPRLLFAGRFWCQSGLFALLPFSPGHRASALSFGDICMKAILYFAFFGLTLGSTGCITMSTIDSAQGFTIKNAKDEIVQQEKPKPAYYALLPLTIPADIIASPFYLYCYVAFEITGDGP